MVAFIGGDIYIYMFTARFNWVVLETPFQKIMCRENKKNAPADFVRPQSQSMFMLYARLLSTRGACYQA